MAARILVVEDDKEWLGDLEKCFKERGWEWDVKESLEDIKAIENFSEYSAVILDLSIPGCSDGTGVKVGNGKAALDFLLTQGGVEPERVVAWSVYDDFKHQYQVLHEGVVKFVSKNTESSADEVGRYIARLVHGGEKPIAASASVVEAMINLEPKRTIVDLATELFGGKSATLLVYHKGLGRGPRLVHSSSELGNDEIHKRWKRANDSEVRAAAFSDPYGTFEEQIRHVAGCKHLIVPIGMNACRKNLGYCLAVEVERDGFLVNAEAKVRWKELWRACQLLVNEVGCEREQPILVSVESAFIALSGWTRLIPFLAVVLLQIAGVIVFVDASISGLFPLMQYLLDQTSSELEFELQVLKFAEVVWLGLFLFVFSFGLLGMMVRP
jgi:CheY-like chemotaxis protein